MLEDKANKIFLSIIALIAIMMLVLFAIIIISFVIAHFWNWCVPAIFGLPEITEGQAFALWVLITFMFSGAAGSSK